VSESDLFFGPFRLQAVNQLWRGDQLVRLRRQTLALLRYLAERPGQLVKKEDLLKQLWPRIYVSSTVVKVCVREIRHALEDEAAKPRFIETVGAQGYRFIGQVLSRQYPVASSEKVGDSHQPTEGFAEPLTIENWQPATPFVGRERELAQLQAWYARVQQGERQIAFVSGEAGIGKTTLVERFLTQAREASAVRIGRGQCVEQTGPREPYLPLLQALQQLCKAPDGDQVISILRRYAPLWLLQLAGVLEADERAVLYQQVQGISPQRMLRECAEAVELLAAETPMILFLEDLQWNDHATVELLAYLAQRRERARLLIIGTYRPVETVLSGHPLRRVAAQLLGRGQCWELALELFTPAEVEAYLTQRLAGSPVGKVIGPVLHRRTEGNALFVKHFVDALLQRGLLAAAAGQWELQTEPAALAEFLPDHIEPLLVEQLEGVIREGQQLLAVASVVGRSFTAGEVAAVLKQPLEAVEAGYDELAQQGRFLTVQGLVEGPEGSVTVRYYFRHALYQQALYQRLGLAQRVRWHRQLGEHWAALYGERRHEIAGAVAGHFERGQDYRRALPFRQQAEEHAI
jgi:DNA-binding winged helix-turn-helix (wHTH) protein